MYLYNANQQYGAVQTAPNDALMAQPVEQKKVPKDWGTTVEEELDFFLIEDEEDPL